MKPEIFVKAFNRLIGPLKRRVQLLITRAVINTITDGEGIQKAGITVFKGDDLDKAEVFSNYGFASNPPANSEAVVLAVGGDRAHSVIVATINRDFLLALAPGEAGFHNDKGSHAKLTTAEVLDVLIKKIKIDNGTDELIAVLVDWITEQIAVADKLNTTTTNTLLGPMKLNDFAFFGTKKSALETLKAKLEGFKV